MDEIHAVLLLAVVAVLVCIACVAGVVHFATGIDIVVCLLLGAVVSTTDPAAVIGIFRDVGAPKRLSILAEGESLLNDAVAIAAFGLFMGILVARASGDSAMPADPTAAVGVFLREFVGGLMLGFAMARVAMMILPRLGDSDAAIASVTVSLSYLCFIVADHYIHVSGVVRSSWPRSPWRPTGRPTCIPGNGRRCDSSGPSSSSGRTALSSCWLR